jgi:phosphoribosylformimino-5-aminoimidazole carboxamide ribotide isomerase
VNVIPAIDLQGGKCVRLFQGQFQQATTFSERPLEIAQAYENLRTTDMHVVDLDGARSGFQSNRDAIREIVGQTRMLIQLGGGIRDEATIDDWISAGVARCVIGSMAVTEPGTVGNWLQQYGGDRIVLALDVHLREDGTPLLTTHGWTQATETTLFDAIEGYMDVGLKHVLCTDVSRDGAMAGPNLQLYGDIMRRFPGLLLQASGGVRNIADLVALRERGIPAAITGRALLEGALTAEEVRSFLQSE